MTDTHARRRVIYQVAASLDGFIAGPAGEADWIVMDPAIDFGALLERYDTVVMGRRTYEAMGGGGAAFGKRTIVASRNATGGTKSPSKGVEWVSDALAAVRELRTSVGRDVWLFGGGVLASELLDAGLVDVVEVALIPVVLGRGLPLAATRNRHALKLRNSRVYDTTGTVLLTYES